LKVVGKPLCGVPLAIAFDRNPSVDNAGLVEAVSNIVKDMHDDDTLRTLSIKWFGEDLTSVG
jgi:ABC-type amino acid transport substrate-binding protein